MAWQRCNRCDLGWVLKPGTAGMFHDDWQKCLVCDGVGYVGDTPPPGPERPPSLPPPDRGMWA